MTDASTPFPLSADFGPDALRFPIDVSIPSDVRYIERVVGVIIQRCTEHQLPTRHCTLNVPVALTEALSNAMLYGNRADNSKSVRLRATLSDVSVVFEVADQGSGFDLDACTSDPTLGANVEREDGRGLFLMRRLMDRVERFTDGGNVVRLTLLRT
ncbi:MAG: ATP-binding protein [Gemmatimonadaceae bacterium]